MADGQFDYALFIYQPTSSGYKGTLHDPPANNHAQNNSAYRERLKNREAIDRPAEKRCCTCQLMKPADQFHKNRSERDGLATRCKSCKSHEHKATYEKRAANYVAAAEKLCIGCNQTKPGSEFTRQTAAKDGLSTYCRTCQPAKSAANYAQNREERIEAAWIWQKRNPERTRAARIATRSNARAAAAGAEGTFTTQEWLDLVSSNDHRCSYCRTEQSPHGLLTADHKMPLTRGGTNWISNVAPACRSCNGSKGDKTPEEFAAWLKSAATRLAAL